MADDRGNWAAAARRIHDDLPVVDGHNDLPWAIHLHAEGDLDRADPGTPLPQFHTDVERLRRGGVGVQFWSVYVPSRSPAPLRQTLEQIDLTLRMIDRNSADLQLARTTKDIADIRAAGKIACLLGAEGGHAIEGSLAALRMLHTLGVRYMTLTHAENVPWADSATDEPAHGGLTDFGVEVVHEMNRIGMLVDISHVSVDTMRDALEVSRAPLIASHSSAAALTDHPRNIPDEVLRGVAGAGGVVMVNFFPGFVLQAAAEMTRGMFEVHRALQSELTDDREVDARMRAMQLENPIPRGSVDDVADHVEHVARVAGVDHVGLGSDFDGIETTPIGLEDVSTYPAITERLLARGWSEEDVRKVLGGNALRALAAAESHARISSP
jgi:membrane dipeptidase